MMSAYETPEIRAVFNHELKNVAGKIRTEHAWQPLSVPEGISQVRSAGAHKTLQTLIFIAEIRQA